MTSPSSRPAVLSLVLSLVLVLGGCGRAGYETGGTGRDGGRSSDAGVAGDARSIDTGTPDGGGDHPRSDAALDADVDEGDAGGGAAVLDVCAGKHHSCAVTTPGKVWCWGENGFGQLGDGTATAMRATPVRAGAIEDAVEVACGMRHTCARHASGEVSCWGWGASGQLGDGSNVDRATPGPVGGLSGPATHIAVGWANSCALIENGTIQCWGYNNVGQLGDGTTMDRRSPVTVPAIEDAIGMANGGGHACAVHADGSMSCWGSNSSGKLGDGTATDSLSPVAVVGISTAVRAAASPGHTCALLSTGRVACWGSNSDGQLGDGTLVDSPTAVDVVELAGAVQVSTLGDVSCARTTIGEVRCWGENGAGQLGDGTTITRRTPARVAGLSDLVASSAGETHSCAATVSAVWCWGSNAGGKLGDGTTAWSVLPVRALVP